MNVFLVHGGDINPLHKSGTIQWPRGQKLGHICVLRQQLEVQSGAGERDSAVGSPISVPPPKLLVGLKSVYKRLYVKYLNPIKPTSICAF